MLAIPLALLAATSNALASVLQRKAAAEAQASRDHNLGPRLVIELLHRPLWFFGVLAIVAAFAFQALALGLGKLALVQPLLVAELPIALVIAARIFHRSMSRRDWTAIVAMAGGLALVLASAHPSGGRTKVPTFTWGWAACTAVLVAGGCIMVARGRPGGQRAALLAAATGTGFALEASFVKAVTNIFDRGILSLFGAWQLYAMVLSGAASMYLLQQALQAGPLWASQPALSISDPIVAIALGIVVFREKLGGGVLLLPELAGAVAMLYGIFTLARSPVSSDDQDEANPGKDAPAKEHDRISASEPSP
jgi:drug/metabolite transporter (DMT)-like permease